MMAPRNSLLLFCAGACLLLLVVVGTNNGSNNLSQLRGGSGNVFEAWPRRLQQGIPFLLNYEQPENFSVSMEPPNGSDEEANNGSIIPLLAVEESNGPVPPKGPFLMLTLEDSSEVYAPDSVEQETPEQQPAILLSLLEPVTKELKVPETVVETSTETSPKSEPFLLSLLEPKAVKEQETAVP